MNIRSIAPMRTAKAGYIVVSSLLITFGAVIMLLPNFSVKLLGSILGVAMIVFGVVKMIGYFSKDLFRLAFQYDLAFGLLLIALGMIVLIRPSGAFEIICVGIGIAILTDGLLKIQIAVDSRRFGLRKWWLIMTAAIVTCCIGLLLVFRPGTGTTFLMTILGCALMVEGLLNLITVLVAVKIVKNQQSDIVDADIREI